MISHQSILSPQRASRWKGSGFLFALAVVTLIAYSPALLGGFVFDDPLYVVENEKLTTPEGLWRVWIEPTAYAYHPLVMTTFWIEYQLWGLHPFGYHLVNVLLHLANALLLLGLMKQLGMAGAGIASFLFALHPVHVESVAWITERKDVLSGFFSLVSVYLWNESQQPDEGSSGKKHWFLFTGSLGAFILAMLAKSSVCMVPFFLLLLEQWKGKGLLRATLKVIPFLLAAGAIGGIYWFVERTVALPLGEEYQQSLLQRILIAAQGIWFYLYKLIWPIHLMPIYPRWENNPSHLLSWAPVTSLIAVLGFLYFQKGLWGRGLRMILLGFILILLPSLGFIPFSFQRFSFVADHFQYLASALPLAGAGVLGSWFIDSWNQGKKYLRQIGVGVVCAVLVVLTWNQCRIYKDNVSFWSHNVFLNPSAFYPRDHLGQALFNSQRFKEAIQVFEEGLRIHPEEARFHFGLARVHAQMGNRPKALDSLRETIRIDPGFANAYRNLAIALAADGKMNDAIQYFEECLRLEPQRSDLYNDYGSALQEAGKWAESIAVFRSGIQKAPPFAPLHFNLAASLRQSGEFTESIDQYKESLRLAPEETARILPEKARTHFLYSQSLEKKGNWHTAIEQIEQACAIAPRNGEYREALQRLRKQQANQFTSPAGASE